MLTPEQSLKAIAGASDVRFITRQARYWRRKRDVLNVAMELEGAVFGSVIQRQRVILRKEGEPVRYGALYCTGCKRPLPHRLHILELLDRYYQPEDGCGRWDCKLRSLPSRIHARQADLTHGERVALNLSLYKLLLPELVPTAYGGTFGFPDMQPVVPTDMTVAKRFCREMGEDPKGKSRKFFLHLGRNEEALIPQACLFNSAIPVCLLTKLQDVFFTLPCDDQQLTYFDLEELGAGKFSECVLKLITPKVFDPLYEQRTEAMSAVFKKVEGEEVRSCVRSQNSPATRFYSDLYNQLSEMPVEEALEVTNIPDEVTLGNLYNAMKRRGLNPGEHYKFNKRIFTEEGMRLPKASRIYIARKVAPFPENPCNRR